MIYLFIHFILFILFYFVGQGEGVLIGMTYNWGV